MPRGESVYEMIPKEVKDKLKPILKQYRLSLSECASLMLQMLFGEKLPDITLIRLKLCIKCISEIIGANGFKTFCDIVKETLCKGESTCQ